MQRKAYRCYFKDSDMSYKFNDFYYLIETKEEIEYQEIDREFELNEKEGLKAFVFDKELLKWKHIKELGPKTIKVKGYVLRLEVFDISLVSEEIANEYLNSIFRVERGKLFTNGNSVTIVKTPTIKEAHTSSTIKMGMFNVLGVLRAKASGYIGNRNIIAILGDCLVLRDGAVFCPKVNIVARNDNYIVVEPQYNNTINIVADSSNKIRGQEIDEVCIFKKNNIVIEPNLNLENVYVLPTYPKLAFRTTIVRDGNVGENFIEVKDTKYVLANIKFMFSSKEKGFVFRKVKKVKGNRIYFDKKINKGEEPIVNGLCFAEVPKELDEIKTELTKEAFAFSRRVYVDEINENVFLRDVRIGNFKTIALYYDKITSLLIIEKTLTKNFPKNTEVVFDEYKFVGPFEFEIGKELPNVFIGQKIYVDDKVYTIKGFDLETKEIELEEVDFQSLIGKKALTEKIPEHMYNVPVSSFRKLNIVYGKKYLDTIEVDSLDGLKEGSYLLHNDKILQIEALFTKNSKNFVKLEKSFLPFVMEDCLINGKFVSSDKVTIDEISQYYKEFDDFIKDSK